MLVPSVDLDDALSVLIDGPGNVAKCAKRSMGKQQDAHMVSVSVDPNRSGDGGNSCAVRRLTDERSLPLAAMQCSNGSASKIGVDSRWIEAIAPMGTWAP